MRKSLSGLILCVILLFALPLPAYATNRVDTMDIQAVLYEDGSMYVFEENCSIHGERKEQHDLRL